MPLFKKRRGDDREKRSYGYASEKNNYRGGKFQRSDDKKSGSGRRGFSRPSHSFDKYSAADPAEERVSAAEAAEAVREAKRRRRAKEQAEAPYSPEQEAALKSISLLLRQNAETFADVRSWLFIRAHYCPELFYPNPESGFSEFAFASEGSTVTCEQSSARAFRRLARMCLSPKDRVHRSVSECMLFLGGEEAPQIGLAQPWDENREFKAVYDAAVILGTTSRSENYANFSRALRCVKPGGFLIYSVINSLGGSSFERAMCEFAPLHLQLSKYHCRTFAVKVPESSEMTEKMQELLKEWHSGFEYRLCEESGLQTRPGIFSWNKLDGGSALLSDYLRTVADLRGVGADLGSANGCLTKAVLESVSYKAGTISRIDLFEDEYLSLAGAKLSLKGIGKGVRLGFNWADVISEVPSQQYDWIVMNPPFHQGQTKVLNLGREFVAAASAALTWRGVLYVVVNRTLPYEDTLENYFENYEKVAENNGFKVFKASGPIRGGSPE